MRKVLFIIFTFYMASVHGQNACDSYKLMKEGASYTMKTFDPKGKLTSTSKNEVKSVGKKEEATEIVIHNETSDHKGKSINSGEIAMLCEGNVIYFDLRSMMNPQNMAGFEKMEINVENPLMEMPVNLSEGQELKDAHMRMNITSEGTKVATMDMKISNRVVLAKENVTTEAGSFEAWKIKYNMETVTTTIIPLRITGSGIDWFVPEIGTVKSESYNRNGKLSGSSVMTEIKY